MKQLNERQNELTDAELAAIQGGGWLSDVWKRIKDLIIKPPPGPFPPRPRLPIIYY